MRKIDTTPHRPHHREPTGGGELAACTPDPTRAIYRTGRGPFEIYVRCYMQPSTYCSADENVTM
jgi:hypothetical protein